jgi:chromosome partitioning protein
MEEKSPPAAPAATAATAVPSASIILIGGTKGGSGKSTTACQLAVMRALAGRRVALYDLDKQRSSHRFVQTRTGAGVLPAIRSYSGYLDILPGDDPVPLGQALTKDLRQTASQYDDVLVDCGGTDNAALRFAMRVADQMFVPLAPAQFDVWALSDLNKVLNDVVAVRQELRPVVIPSLVSPNTNEKAELDQVKLAYKSFDFAPPGVGLCLRAAFRRGLGSGCGVFDAKKPDSKARSELLGVYRTVFHEDWSRYHDQPVDNAA